MPEDIQGLTPTPANPPSAPAPVPATDVNAGEATAKTFDEAYVKELRSEAAKHRKEKQELAERLAALETASKQQEEKKLTEQQEWQKLAEKRAAELEAIKAELANERLNFLRTAIGAEFKLPPVVAKRLTGSTEDELRADAKTIAAELKLDQPATEPAKPEPQAPPPPAQTGSPFTPARSQVTAPTPGGSSVGETEAAKLRRLYSPYAEDVPLFKNTRR